MLSLSRPYHRRRRPRVPFARRSRRAAQERLQLPNFEAVLDRPGNSHPRRRGSAEAFRPRREANDAPPTGPKPCRTQPPAISTRTCTPTAGSRMALDLNTLDEEQSTTDGQDRYESASARTPLGYETRRAVASGCCASMLMHRRQLDNRGFQLNRQGEGAVRARQRGPRSAAEAGAAMAFHRGKDILAPYYRDLGLAIGIGLTPFEILLSLFARAEDHNGGRQFPATDYSSKAAGHAVLLVRSSRHGTFRTPVGAAYPRARSTAAKKRDRAVLVTCGDGTTSEGEVARVDAELRGRIHGANCRWCCFGREQRVGDLDAAARRLRWRNPKFGSGPPVTECPGAASTDSIRSKRTAW